ncbi:3-phosphoglycerate dehydrogenase [Thioalkalivibrio denitrificans]|uniref:3-phosphoglycerate dehydrogenase n=1 Tax=Thioalkalivibrio denitrificans TaxID=108003 RepID=A0A1V3NS51_9GAMM|nr:hydroxyacid dehydrogenase [Thioalkalivibrio denitrificans]OOG27698.1 3-phosphoglycerate dehydrogenase [Thioalkalivibrio denitrificans]
MPRIVITEFMDTEAVQWLSGRHETHYDPKLVDEPDKLAPLLADCEALIVRNRTQVRPDLLGKAPALKVVGRLGVGLDNIDQEACKGRGVQVIPATGANALAVAEYVICTAMMLLRGAYLSSDQVAAGEWPRPALSKGRELSGKTLGLAGFGGIGQLTARLARGLGMHTVAYDPYLKPDAPALKETDTRLVDMDGLLAESDVISLHIPLTDETRNLFDAKRIAAMRKGSVLINSARGGIVDEVALASALKEGHLAGAALDVFNDEPLAAGSPLADIRNLVLTPHIAGVTEESNTRVSRLIAERVAEALG